MCYSAYSVTFFSVLILMQASFEVKIQKYARKSARFLACVIRLRVQGKSLWNLIFFKYFLAGYIVLATPLLMSPNLYF